MVIEKKSTLVKTNPEAATLYLVIPADLVKDSAFPFSERETVNIRIDPKNTRLIIEPL